MSDGYDYDDPYDRHPRVELPSGCLAIAMIVIAFAALAVCSALLIWMFGAILRAVAP